MKRFMKCGLVPFMLIVLAAASVSGVENEIDSLATSYILPPVNVIAA